MKEKSTIIAESIDQEQLEFVVIPNFLESDAIFKSLEGITVIIHLASPLAIEVIYAQRTGYFSRLTFFFWQADDYEVGIVKPTISMVTSVLEAATRVSTIRRVILTSSCMQFLALILT